MHMITVRIITMHQNIVSIDGKINDAVSLRCITKNVLLLNTVHIISINSLLLCIQYFTKANY